MDYFFAVILGIIEGLTEFLPISSTGHLLVATSFLQFPTFIADPVLKERFQDTYSIFIQLGAIIAVLLYYWRDLRQQAQRIRTDRGTQRFWLNIVLAFIPAAVVGFLFRRQIKEVLFNPSVIGLALIVGGIVFLIVERQQRQSKTHALEEITTRQAVLIGLAQLTALVPGVSRSGASIIGAMLLGLNRPTATAFSFYLSIPTLGLATIYEMVSALRDGEIAVSYLPYFIVGAVVAFGVAYASIVWLLRFVASNNFRIFGYYRIVAGLIILGLALFTPLLR